MRAAGASVLLAALLIGVSVGAACWATEATVLGSVRSGRLDDVRSTLQVARSLIAGRERAASTAASHLAGRPDVQSAFLQRDAPALLAISRAQPGVAFALWDGRTVGVAGLSGPSAAVTVYSRGRYVGRVIVGVRPDAALLRSARERSLATQLVLTVGGRVVAASPPAGRRSVAALLRGSVHDDLSLGSSNRAAAQLYAFRSQPRIPLRRLWPFVAMLAASGLAFEIFGRREARRRAEPPPNTVRDAVALVGETLAATHNPQALLPVILRAAVEATDASGGTITADGSTLATRGSIPPDAVETLKVTLEVKEGQPAMMTLFPPAAGFGVDARDAAAWIASQALIALENARLHGQVQRQAVTDELTGLANRRRFLSQLEAEVARSRRNGSPLGIVLADLDDFKRVNDTYGHQVGDEALRGFAEILLATVRDVDLAVRLGGEEFAVLLPDTDLAGSAQLAERLRHALQSRSIGSPGVPIMLTASFGVSCFPAAAAAEDLLTDADRRLYDAKRRGKNTVIASKALRSTPRHRRLDVE